MKELGELVRAARIQRDITLERAAAETRIRLEYLAAIEDGDFRIFPGPAYATGFLRNYAGYLGLNPDEVLQTYHALAPATVISIQPATTVGIERLRRRSRRRLTWLFASMIVVFLGAVAIHYYNTPARGAGVRPRSPLVSTSGLSSPSTLFSRHHKQRTRSGSRSGREPLVRHQGPPLWKRTRAAAALHAQTTTWVFVKVDNRGVFWGRLLAGHYRRWTGKTITVRTHHGNDLRAWADGRKVGLLSGHPGLATLSVERSSWHRLG